MVTGRSAPRGQQRERVAADTHRGRPGAVLVAQAQEGRGAADGRAADDLRPGHRTDDPSEDQCVSFNSVTPGLGSKTPNRRQRLREDRPRELPCPSRTKRYAPKVRPVQALPQARLFRSERWGVAALASTRRSTQDPASGSAYGTSRFRTIASWRSRFAMQPRTMLMTCSAVGREADAEPTQTDDRAKRTSSLWILASERGEQQVERLAFVRGRPAKRLSPGSGPQPSAASLWILEVVVGGDQPQAFRRPRSVASHGRSVSPGTETVTSDHEAREWIRGS